MPDKMWSLADVRFDEAIEAADFIRMGDPPQLRVRHERGPTFHKTLDAAGF